ncbi:MAG: MFS transporter [Syntrophomonas sp.]|nr:MFS transporter [Syntrophomonas sp.]
MMENNFVMPKRKKTLMYRYVIFFVVALAYFFVYFHRTTPAVMAPELINSFNTTPVALGLFSSMYFYAYALGQLPAGILADRWGVRKTISIFILIAGLGAIMFGIAGDFNTALLARFLVGFGVGFVYVPAMRLLTDWFMKNEFAFYSGILLAVGNLGSLASTAPLVFIMGIWGWRNSMIFVGIVSIVIGIISCVFIRDKPCEIGGASISEIEGLEVKAASPPTIGIIKSLSLIFKNYNFWTIAILYFVFYGSIMGFQGLWAGPYLSAVYGFNKAETSKLLAMIPLGMIIGGPLSGWLSDKVFKSRKKVVLTGMILYTLAWLPMLLWVDSIPRNSFVILWLLYGIFGGFAVVMYANLRENIDSQIAGTGIGCLNVFLFVGGAVFQQVMGLIITGYPEVNMVIPAAAFKSSFIFCFVALIAALAFYATQKEKICN